MARKRQIAIAAEAELYYAENWLERSRSLKQPYKARNIESSWHHLIVWGYYTVVLLGEGDNHG